MAGQTFDFEMYPNPTNRRLTLVIHEGSEVSQVEIYTIDGKLLFSQEIEGDSKSFDLSDLEAGVYMIKVLNKSISRMKRLVKTN